MSFSHNILLILVVAGLVCGSSIICPPAIANRTAPRVLYVGGSGPGNYTRIQEAVNASADGDTVFVYDDSSPYEESIAVHTSITILGENRSTTIVQGGTHAFYVYADNVRVSGFTIRDVGDFWNCCGVYAISTGDVFDNLTIAHNQRMNGIFLEGATYSTIRDCLIEDNNYRGIRMEFADHNQILNTTIRSVRGEGIYLWSSSDNDFEGNTVQAVYTTGILLDGDSWSNTIIHNNVIDNPTQAYDNAGGNRWDDGSGIGGNFWSDYTGADLNQDGFGDTPYPISGNLSQDAFPLMRPYGPAMPLYQVSVRGGLGVSLLVKNIGPGSGQNISWSVTFSGGLLLLPLRHTRAGVIPALAPDEETTVRVAPLMLGLGSMTAAGTLGGQPFEQAGVLLLVYFILRQ